MSVTPTTSADILLTFTWDDDLEERYSSWRREVALAERLHRTTAERLRRRNAVVTAVLIVLSVSIAAIAFAWPRIDLGLLARAGIDADAIRIVIGAMATGAALLAMLQAVARFARRAETHRIAAIRYRALDREMRVTLAIPRDARPQPDRELAGVRERIDRYAAESPSVPRRLRRAVEAEAAQS